VHGIIEHLSQSGKAGAAGDRFAKSPALFSANQQLNKAGYYERLF
jgi:hypothetical protein